MIELRLEKLERGEDGSIVGEPGLVQRVDDGVELLEDGGEEGRRGGEGNGAVDERGEVGQEGGEGAGEVGRGVGVHFGNA